MASNGTNNRESGKVLTIALVVLLIICVVIIGGLAYLSRDKISSIGATIENSSSKVAEFVEKLDSPEKSEKQIPKEEVVIEEVVEEPAPETLPEPEPAQVQEVQDPEPEQQQQQQPVQQQQEQPAQSKSVIQPGNPVVAKVGDSEIRRLEVLEFIDNIPSKIRQDRSAVELFPQALSEMVDVMVVSQRATDSNISKSPEVKKQLDIARQRIERSVYLQEQVENYLTQDKLLKAYDEYAKTAPREVEFRAQHILVSSEDEAKDVIARLEKGSSFETLATALSIDESATNGGDLGYFTLSEVVPEFGNAVEKLTVGQYSKQPVKTQFGWHVIKLTDKRARSIAGFEAMQPEIKKSIQDKVLNELLDDWRMQADVQVFDINGNAI